MTRNTFSDVMHVHPLTPTDYFRQCSYAAAGFSAGFMLPGRRKLYGFVCQNKLVTG